MQRVALVTFGVLFAGLSVALALAVGVGSLFPGVPRGDVAVVEDAPAGIGAITEAEFEQEMLQLAGGKQAPRPDEEGYEHLKQEALGALINAIWLRGATEAMGIEVGAREIAAQLRKGGNGRSLRKAGFTPHTMRDRARGELLVLKIEAALEKEAAKPSAAEVRSYYEEELLGEEGTPQKSFAAAKDEALADLQQIRNQEVFSRFDFALPRTWQPRTHCAGGFVVDSCAEYPDFAHSEASACYEADPKEPAEVCPAPVQQTPAAEPGSITPFKPQGESRAQHPYPEASGGEIAGR